MAAGAHALGSLRAALAPGEFNLQADAASFRIAIADAAAATFMPHLVAQIEQARARANLRLLPLTSRDPSRQLERGEADLAIGHFPETLATLADAGIEATLRQQSLQESGYVCVMLQGHPLARGELTLDGYCAAHHLLVSFSGRANGRADLALAALKRERRVVLTVNQYFTAGRVVANSNLLTVLPASFVGAAGFREKVVTRAAIRAGASAHHAAVAPAARPRQQPRVAARTARRRGTAQRRMTARAASIRARYEPGQRANPSTIDVHRRKPPCRSPPAP